MKAVMNTRWEDLVMVNYEVDRGWAERFVPAGCELELFCGKALVSVVAFRFHKTGFFGVRVPFYRDFAEINLRIYVRRKVAVGGDFQRGVVFIKELIPYRLPAMIANRVFRENFGVMPVVRVLEGDAIEYVWGENRVRGEFSGGLVDWDAGGEEEFVGDNFWAYKDEGRAKGRTCVFEVRHRAWRMRKLVNVEVGIDMEGLYGAEWARNVGVEPCSVFYVDGSEVGVGLPRRLMF